MGKYLDMAKAFQARQQATRTEASRTVSPAAGLGKRTLNGELQDATPPGKALAVYPDWRGLLIKSKVLGFSVWVVRSRADGLELSRETGDPAVMLDDILRQKGKSEEETITALLPVLIMAEQ